MRAGPTSDIWTAEPHTIAKIDILESYLVAYFQILGRTRPRQPFLCIDGFAGPNQYVNRPSGSPSAALNAAQKAIANSGDAWKAGTVHFAFVESHARRFEILSQTLADYGQVHKMSIHTFNAEFTTALPLIMQKIPSPFVSDNPLFAFIDPFGATGAPFACVAEILNSPCSEVLINLDADGVSRIYKAKQSANHVEVLTQIFGDGSWQGKLDDNQSFDEQCRTVLQLYKERLRALPGVKYIFEVEMRGASGTLNYFLVFASKHPLGLMKMKEAMKSIAQNGTYTFADTDIGQTAMFRDDNPEAYHMALYNAFKGQKVDYDSMNDDVTAYALNLTPFVDAKSMLRILEREDLITAYSSDPKRKRGTFNNTVKTIDFHGKVQNGLLF